MLEIKIRQPKEGVCPICEGSGIVIPKDGIKRVVEVGRFCSECEEGRRRWEETVKLMAEINSILGVGGSTGRR